MGLMVLQPPTPWLHLWQKPWLSQGAQSTQYEEINVCRNLHKQAVNVCENIIY